MERKLKYLAWEIKPDLSVVVKTESLFTSPPGATYSGSLPCRIVLSFHNDGSVQVDSTLYIPSSFPPVPRVGLSCSLHGSFSTVEWCGLGPHEAYSDRKECCHLGVFSSAVKDLHTPYVVPQENGHRMSPR